MRTQSLTRTLPKPVFFQGNPGPSVATQHKHAALLNRLFVPQRQSSAPDAGAAVGASNTLQQQPSGSDAVSGTQTAAAAPAEDSAVNPPAVAPAAAAAAAGQTAGMEGQEEQAEIEEADKFLQHSVVPWLEAMQKEASDRSTSLPAVLKTRMRASVTQQSNGQPLASSLADLVLHRFRALVSWKGYVNFHALRQSVQIF